MEGTYLTCVGSIQHPPGKMVCQHHWFFRTRSFQHWQHLDISKDPKQKKVPENMFKAIANTLEVSTSYWNHINEMYSDIRQGEQETTNQLDQHIKVLVENCGYSSEEEKKKH